MNVTICGGKPKGSITITGGTIQEVGDVITASGGSISGSTEFDACTANGTSGNWIITGGSLSSTLTITGGSLAGDTITGGTVSGCFSVGGCQLTQPQSPSG
jgi:hypothetical protein